MRRTIVLCSLIFFQIPSQAYADLATVTRSSHFRSKPLLNAPILTTITEGQSVELLGSVGGWSRVKTSDGKIGFVRLLNIKPVNTKNSKPLEKIGNSGNVVRTGSTKAIAVTGVRGVSDKVSKEGTPNSDCSSAQRAMNQCD